MYTSWGGGSRYGPDLCVNDQADNEALRYLFGERRLKDLDRYVSSLALIRALDAVRDEGAHSRLLAALFDPRRNQSVTVMLRMLLRRIVNYPRLEQTSSYSPGRLAGPKVAQHVEIARQMLPSSGSCDVASMSISVDLPHR